MKTTKSSKKSPRYSPYTKAFKDITNTHANQHAPQHIHHEPNIGTIESWLHLIEQPDTMGYLDSLEETHDHIPPSKEELLSWIRHNFQKHLLKDISLMNDNELLNFLLSKAPQLLNSKHLILRLEIGQIKVEDILRNIIKTFTTNYQDHIASILNEHQQEDRYEDEHSSHPIQVMNKPFDIRDWIDNQPTAEELEPIQEQQISDEPSTMKPTDCEDNPNLADLPFEELYKFYPLNAEEDGFHATAHPADAPPLCIGNLELHNAEMLQQLEYEQELNEIEALASHLSFFTL